MKKIAGCFFIFIGFLFSAFCIVYTVQYLFVEKKADGYFIWNRIIFCDPTGICFHELGHAKDEQLDNPSQSPEFVKAVEGYLKWCKSGKRFWPTECEHLENFPGINGNGLRFGVWGGYDELYADLFMFHIWDNLCVPEDIAIFFNIHWRMKVGR